jgi:hypothetical protein
MAGSWREILDGAAADRADNRWSVPAGEDRSSEERPAGEQAACGEPRKFDEPELAAFLTRLASPPDIAPPAPAEDGPPPARRAPALGPKRLEANSLAVPVAAATPALPPEPEKAAPPAFMPPPVSRKRRATRDALATMLLAATMGVSAYAMLSPGAKPPDAGQPAQSPGAITISASRVEVEGRRGSHRSHAAKAKHKRTRAGRPVYFSRCAYEPDLPGCQW